MDFNCATSTLVRSIVAVVALAGAVIWIDAMQATAHGAEAAVSGGSPLPAGQRPRVCLVLSGGGARGAAHIGVIKVLEELHVRIDCIAGTSMGAVVGASYASGNPISRMERLLAELSTGALFNERLPREERSVRRKQDDLINLIGPEIGFRSGEVLLPKGIVSGIQLEAVLRRLASLHDRGSFDELPIPFRAVATDLATGKPVVMADGNLADAMRASMSVPGVVAPAEFDGRLLVDGGLTNNLPVDVARSIGADIVIAVNLGTPLLKRDALGSVLGVTAQMVNILTEQNVREALSSLKPTDVLIEPELGDYSSADFDNMVKTVPIGEVAARKFADRLAALAVTPQEYAEWRRQVRIERRAGADSVDEIRFLGLRRVNPRYAQTLLDTRIGQPLDRNVLDRDMHRLYGTGDFEHVRYRYLQEQGKGILTVDAVEKSWGPDYLRFGLGLSSDFRGDATYNLLLRYRKTWLSQAGAEWRGEVQLGRADRLFNELYFPLGEDQSVFLAPYGQLERRPIDFFERNLRIARYGVRMAVAGLDLGVQASSLGEARFGLTFGRAHAKLDTGSESLTPSELDARSAALRTRLVVDQIDSASFPRSGYGGSMTLLNARRALGADSTYNRWETDGTFVRSFGSHTLNLGFKLGDHSRVSPDLFQWGGFLQQSGYRPGALVGDSIRFGRLVYYNKLMHHSLLEGVYAGFSLEAGKFGTPLTPRGPTGLQRSASVFVAFDSPLGPLYLAYGRTTEGLYSYYLYLGRP